MIGCAAPWERAGGQLSSSPSLPRHRAHPEPRHARAQLLWPCMGRARVWAHIPPATKLVPRPSAESAGGDSEPRLGHVGYVRKCPRHREVTLPGPPLGHWLHLSPQCTDPSTQQVLSSVPGEALQWPLEVRSLVFLAEERAQRGCVILPAVTQLQAVCDQGQGGNRGLGLTPEPCAEPPFLLGSAGEWKLRLGRASAVLTKARLGVVVTLSTQSTSPVTQGDFCEGQRGTAWPGREFIFRAHCSRSPLGDLRCWLGGMGAGVGVSGGRHVSGLIITQSRVCPLASPPYKGSRELGSEPQPRQKGAGWQPRSGTRSDPGSTQEPRLRRRSCRNGMSQRNGARPRRHQDCRMQGSGKSRSTQH